MQVGEGNLGFRLFFSTKLVSEISDFARIKCGPLLRKLSAEGKVSGVSFNVVTQCQSVVRVLKRCHPAVCLGMSLRILSLRSVVTSLAGPGHMAMTPSAPDRPRQPDAKTFRSFITT